MAYCMYDVVPKTATTDRDNQNRVPGFVELHASWTFPNMNPCSDEILSKPIPSASVFAVCLNHDSQKNVNMQHDCFIVTVITVP